MTPEQSAAFLFSQSVCLLVTAMGMQAENQQRVHRGESLAYTGSDFQDLINESTAHHNSALIILNQSS